TYLTVYPPGDFNFVESELLGTDPFVGNTLPAGACANYNYVYYWGSATPDTDYHFSVDVKPYCTDTSITHNTLDYEEVLSEGQCWLDRNLGASQVATAYNDYNAYGDLYQWGRATEGHEAITWTSSGGSNGLEQGNETSTNATTAVPGGGSNAWDGQFIREGNPPYDWLTPQDNTLWEGVNGTNNPCPAGYRLPTQSEFEVELGSWTSIPNTYADAYASPLKLPVAGARYFSNGTLVDTGDEGFYWTSTDVTHARCLYFDDVDARICGRHRGYGFPVRCIKD
ncbi:MAG: hypothetical protein GY703_18110, partial [Gammaproteobacteria bacterium]|nr:hypothetical protein [Gammaproteobacteria bacterium]